MKKIIFRGRCLKSNDLVYGDLIHGVGFKRGNVYILPNKINLAHVKHCDPLDGVRVDPETIGQFTGLSDRNGKEIYEGDAFKDGVYVVYEDGQFGTTYNGNHQGINRLSHHRCGLMEIIGNIFENPELLKV